MVAEFPLHDYLLVVDRQTAETHQFPEGARIEVVNTRRQQSRAASATSARSLWDLWKMARAVSRHRLDVFFFPAVYSYYPLVGNIPIAITFHDAIADQHPELIFPGLKARLYWSAKMWLALRQADCVLTVSEDARSQIAAAYHYPKSQIHVVHEGVNAIFRPLECSGTNTVLLERYHIPSESPLILYVGGLSPHKNIQGLLRALNGVRRTTSIQCHLVIVGDYEHDSFYSCYHDLLSLAHRLGLERCVTFTGFVPDDHLVALLNAASLFVQPSFSEGFGLPALEAMACGVPVVASKRGSLPEVLGSAGVFFDPNNHREMASVLVRLLQDSALRKRLRTDGLRRATDFSWQVSASKVVRLLEEVVHGSVKTA
jgi:glycosyltransferase involved in cell wall biosynthesis